MKVSSGFKGSMAYFSDSKSRVSGSWSLGLAFLAAVLFIGLTVLSHARLPFMLSQLAFLPILWAAVLFEWRGGLSVALIISVIMGLEVQNGQVHAVDYWLTGSGLYLLFGVICSALFDLRKRRIQKVEYQALHLTEIYTRMLSGLAGTLEIRDRHTQGHSERVAKNAVVLGRSIGLQDRQLETLYWSGILHDLGKIAIPEAVLLKPERLSDAEYAEVKRHPVYGADLLNSVAPEFKEIALAVRYHHERWDGQGYPRGLCQAEIPLFSRIISVVDVFEALTSQRPYRQPLSPAEALSYLKSGSGTHFDPSLVRAFETCFERGSIRYLPESAFSPGESKTTTTHVKPTQLPVKIKEILHK